MECSKQGGLIYRDARRLIASLTGCEDRWIKPSDKTPCWNKVLSQLPMEEILKENKT